MARLVDADIMCKNIKAEDKNHRSVELVDVLTRWINEQPTVDAIPVEWIKALTNHSDMFTRGAAKWVLGCWKKEQEAQDGNM